MSPPFSGDAREQRETGKSDGVARREKTHEGEDIYIGLILHLASKLRDDQLSDNPHSGAMDGRGL